MKKVINRSILLVFAMVLANIIYANHIIVAPSTCMLLGTQAPYNTLQGGDTLLIQSGNKSYIYLKNFTGSSSAPIVVINYGGVVTIGTNFTYGIKIGGCRYMKFTGTGTSAFYGFQVTQTNGDGASIGDLSSDIEINHVYISNCGIRGIVAKTDPACGGYATRNNFTQYNTIIHDNFIENTTTEGMYIGSSFYSGETFTCNGVDSVLLPSILIGCQVYNNIVRHTGYDGIQAASALNLSVHDNLVQYDSQSGVSSQMSGILIGGGSQGDCYNNYVENGEGDGIENLGLGGYKIYNNVIVNPGLNYYPGNQSYPKFGIYTNDCSAIQGSEFDLIFNTIIGAKTTGIKFASTKATASVIENNAIINPGQSGSYIVNNGSSSITIRNNYTSQTIAPAMFQDTTYKTLPGSPLIDAGYAETKGVSTDKYGDTRFQGTAPDCGIYEATNSNLPTLTTTAVTNITQTTATSGGNVTSSGGANVTARGVCWSTSSAPTISGNHTTDGSGTGSFVSNIAGLTAGTLYHVRAYATNSSGTAYGNELTFTTLTLPTVTTTAVTAITQTTATSGGNVTTDGGATVTARGVCWSTSSSPTISGSHTTDGTGTGTFVSNITGLTAGTLYYVRSYATSSIGTVYGNQLSFTTLTAIVLPSVTTNAVTAITQTTATSGGNVTSDGGATVTARGVCWSTSTSPTISGTHTTDGTGTGAFVSNMTGLTAGTLYYVRSYATNSAGTAYGNQLSFTTLTAIVLPSVTTNAVTAITQTTATSGGNVTSDGGATVTVRGVCWSTSSSPTISGSHTTDGTGTGTFVSNITGLTAGTLYYVRSYATNSVGTAYGNQLSFTTLTAIVLPGVTTNAVTAITQTTATSGGNVTSDGGATVTARGVCWSTSTSPTISGTHTTDGTGTGTFVSNITGLTAGTLYYVRSYATNSVGTAYGNQLSFTTLTAIVPPSVTTNPVTAITQTTATSGGNVTSDGGATVTARGVCWSTSSSPTITGSHTTDGTGTGTFVSNMAGLTAGTVYYVRSYATNSAGTAYGNQLSFTTLTAIILPSVITNAVTAITQTTATSGGNVTSDGGATVTAKGVCWSTSSSPTISGSHTTDGTGTGTFVSNMTGLTAGTLYYVRSYATNSAGTAYGNQLSFTTLTAIVLPSVTTNPVTAITQTTATSGGNVTSDGGASVTARGVCWSTSSSPTISGTHTTDGTGTGTFVSNMTGLTAGTLYYVRAYVTNSAGTAYGNELSFTTLTLPNVLTNNVGGITQNNAISGGNVTSGGGCNVSARGVCWNTTPSPGLTNNHTNDGSGTGSFVSTMTGLTGGTIYYVRAYATNSEGTSFGNEQVFTTTSLPTVTTAQVSSITETSAKSGGNVTSDGGETVSARGVCWNTSSSPTISNNHTNDGTGSGTFTSNMTGLTGGTTYYVRAYATNSEGTSYGAELSFTTVTAPYVTTNSVTGITQTTATSGGNVVSNGGEAVTSRGVCWSTSSTPTISDNHTSDGSGLGTFVSYISGLTPNTTYYIRAYATGSNGTTYGNQQYFTTLISSGLPSVTTSSVTHIHSSSATCGGNVTSDGGSMVTHRGVCWSTSPYPTINNSLTYDGNGLGHFRSYMTSLMRNTRYYVRAYATNANGTSYGNQEVFITLRWSSDDEITDSIVPTMDISSMNIYPNPVKTTLNVDYSLSGNSDVNLSVFNLNGVKIFNEQINGQYSGAYTRHIDASSLPEGMYIVIISTGKMVMKKNFIKID